MQKNIIPLQAGEMYHIYNRGIDRQPLFFNEMNYSYFMKLYFKHVSPIADTFAYCLMHNHFHFLIRIHENEDLPTLYQNNESSLSLPFSHWFNAYAQAINKQQNRTGGLFHRPFKRVLIKSQLQLEQAILYIHGNPKHHQVHDEFHQYPFSSFASLLCNFPTQLERDEVMNIFDGKSNFLSAHEAYSEYLDIRIEQG